MNDEARRRIEALQELSELGAGFRLATEDLEIRGAGNVLGRDQSGHIAAIGYDLYMEMLEDAIRRLRGEDVPDEVEPEIRLPLPALLPESYVADPSQRLVLYKQLSSSRDENELAQARDDMLDRFGPLPEEADGLISVIRLRLRCKRLGVVGVDVKGQDLVLRIQERSRIDPRRLAWLIDKPGTPVRVARGHRIHMRIRSRADALAEALGLLELLSPASDEGTSAEAAGSAA
jgi:transcription-repair coupling factor (superfamily II helicase)